MTFFRASPHGGILWVSLNRVPILFEIEYPVDGLPRTRTIGR